MSMVTGVVNEIKAFPAGGTTMYSLIVDGERYGTGAIQPKCKAGDTVEFEIMMKGQYRNVNMKTLRVLSSGGTAAVAKAAVASSMSGDARQETISRQAAANTAIAFVELLRSAGAIPGITAKVDPAKAYDIIEALVMKKAGDFYAFSTGKAAPAQSKATSPFISSGEEDQPDEVPQGEWQ